MQSLGSRRCLGHKPHGARLRGSAPIRILVQPADPASQQAPATAAQPAGPSTACDPPPVPAAQLASWSSSDTKSLAEPVGLAEAIPVERLPTPPGTPITAGEGPLLSRDQAARALAAGPLLLHVDDTDVRKVFEIISRQAKVNILVSPKATGRVTLDLRDMTAEAGLRAVARLCHLTVRREKDILYVYTTAEADQSDDPPVRVYHLNYLRGSDVQKMIKPLLTKNGTSTTSPDSEIGIKSDANKAGGDSLGGGDVLIVQDCQRVLQAVDRVVAQLDVQPAQVLIEAVIVSVKLDKDLELGVNFATLGGNGTVANVLGNGALLNAAAGFPPPKSSPRRDNSWATPAAAWPRPSPATSSATSTVPSPVSFGPWKQPTTSEILATPRLLVVNKQRAELQVGDRLGYETATQTQTSTVQTVQFMDIGTQLRLRPFITCDGIVRMEIHPENSTGVLDSNGIPQTSASQVTTNVMVPDGRTVVIGGLIENDTDVTVSGIPLLDRLPWIGCLFRSTIDQPTRRELIVILTPHIWRPQATAELNAVKAPESIGEAKARAGMDCDPPAHGGRGE